MNEVDMDDDTDLPSLETEEGRTEWVGIILSQEDEDVEWIKAIVVHDGENMVARFINQDGTEEVYDLQIRRSMVVVDKAAPGESN